MVKKCSMTGKVCVTVENFKFGQLSIPSLWPFVEIWHFQNVVSKRHKKQPPGNSSRRCENQNRVKLRPRITGEKEFLSLA